MSDFFSTDGSYTAADTSAYPPPADGGGSIITGAQDPSGSAFDYSSGAGAGYQGDYNAGYGPAAATNGGGGWDTGDATPQNVGSAANVNGALPAAQVNADPQNLTRPLSTTAQATAGYPQQQPLPVWFASSRPTVPVQPTNFWQPNYVGPSGPNAAPVGSVASTYVSPWGSAAGGLLYTPGTSQFGLPTAYQGQPNNGGILGGLLGGGSSAAAGGLGGGIGLILLIGIVIFAMNR